MGATEKPRRELPKPKRRGKANAVARDRNAANGYDLILADVVALLESARHASARAVNAVMTATYWEIGRRIVEFEQGGEKRAEYGKSLLVSLSRDLTEQFGRGFGYVNLTQMRKFFVLWPREGNLQTPSEFFETGIRNESAPIRRTLPGSSAIDRRAAAKSATTSRKSAIRDVANTFPLPWSHYVRLLSVESPDARTFYETEALRSGWTVRQLDRQIASLFYERTLMSRNKSAMLAKGARPKPGDAVSPEEEIKDPLILEFLGLRDEYSESELEGALIGQLERFLLELGGDFAFVGRQRRLRIDDDWYRVDLLFFHRRLRCLVVIDLKVGKFTHADAGQMHMYLNYAREHWTNENENPPVGLILCTGKGEALARYALEGLPNKVLAAQYRLTLPEEKTLVAELNRVRELMDRRQP